MFRPWLFVVFAFLLLAAAWTSLIFVAAHFSPQTVSLETKAKH
jgi:hypothetical protein